MKEVWATKLVYDDRSSVIGTVMILLTGAGDNRLFLILRN